MHKKIVLLTLIVILTLLNYAIIQNERHLNKGETIILKLVPIDPRSMIQGDYMKLKYGLASKVKHAFAPLGRTPKKGFVLVHLNPQHIASFMKIYRGETIHKEEAKLPFTLDKKHQINFGGNTFFFQEGDAKRYEKAAYGSFKLHNETLILQHLLNKELEVIGTTK